METTLSRLPSRRLSKATGAALGLLLPLQLLGLVVAGGEDAPAVAPVAAAPESMVNAVAPTTTSPTSGRPSVMPPTATPTSVAATSTTAVPQLPDPEPDAGPDEVAAPAPAAAPVVAPSKSAAQPRDRFVETFPAQAAASQDVNDPASTRWALLIGINDHAGRVSDNYGSRQDAEELRAHLLAEGWRDDHILLITDRTATRAMMVRGLQWLADKTNGDSVAIFHYSGHSKKWYGRDHDGDGEVTDEGLWPTDDRFIPDSELVRLLDGVDAAKTWINFATCNAQGFQDPGLRRDGRVLTFSSTEAEKSYEHPGWKNSVWGYWLIDQGLLGRGGDADGDGKVTVEEVFGYAQYNAHETTVGQRPYGPQTPQLVDDLPGEFSFEIPPVAPPPTTTTTTPPPADPDRTCLLCS